MELEELERQREALRRQIIDLTFLVHGPDVMPLQKLDKSAPERAFLNYLEDKLEEKKAQLHALDLQIAQASTFRARFHSECYSLRGVIWLAAVGMCLATVTCGNLFNSAADGLMGILTLVSLLWAIWSSFPPK